MWSSGSGRELAWEIKLPRSRTGTEPSQQEETGAKTSKSDRAKIEQDQPDTGLDLPMGAPQQCSSEDLDSNGKPCEASDSSINENLKVEPPPGIKWNRMRTKRSGRGPTTTGGTRQDPVTTPIPQTLMPYSLEAPSGPNPSPRTNTDTSTLAPEEHAVHSVPFQCTDVSEQAEPPK